MNRFFFKTFFIYSLLFIFLFNNDIWPFFSVLTNKLLNLNYIFIVKVLSIKAPYKLLVDASNGSSDTLFNYISLATIIIISFLGGALWSIVEKKENDYQYLKIWLFGIIRLYLIGTFLIYGVIKLLFIQFSPLDNATLLEQYGTSTPMRLAWVFFGFSKGYSVFLGLGECMAILLCFRRTVLAGALIEFIIMVNVVAVNFFYDIPVKILSINLLIMLLFLLSWNFGPLSAFLFSTKYASQKLAPLWPFENKNKKVFAFLVMSCTAYIGFGIFLQIQDSIAQLITSNQPPLYGVYSLNRRDKLSFQSSVKWDLLNIQEQGTVTVFYNRSSQNCAFNVDTVHKRIASEFVDSLSTWSYKMSNDSTLTLNGITNHKDVYIQLKKIKFPLLTRGFHWVNEFPMNK